MIKTKTLGVLILVGACIAASLVNLVRILQGQDIDFHFQLIAIVVIVALFITTDD